MPIQGKPLNLSEVLELLDSRKLDRTKEGKFLSAAHYTRRSGREISREMWLRGWTGHIDINSLSGKYLTTQNTDSGSLHCLSRGCGSPTTFLVRGIPKCSVHALIELARLLDEKDGIFLPSLSVAPDNPRTGDFITVSTEGFTDSEDMVLVIKSPSSDTTSEFTVDSTLNTDGTYTWPNVASFEKPGVVKLRVECDGDSADLDVSIST